MHLKVHPLTKRVLTFALFFLVTISLCKATHNRAGEITYKWISGTTYEVTVTTYTKEDSQADRCELTIYFGDGDSCIAGRTNGDKSSTCAPYGMGVSLGNNIRMNTYTCTHQFPGPGNYCISMEDPNRNGGVINIPNSINTVFFIRSCLVINPFLGTGNNSSPVLLNPPIDNGCTGHCFYHNPGAYDPDGDSLSFKLVACLEAGGSPILGYRLPNISAAGTVTGSLTLDPLTGDLAWCNPVQIGEYNIAILIEEWRNGYLIGNVERDMQITVTACNNTPPDFFSLNDTCVEAGTIVTFPVTAYDIDKNNVTLTAVGGPLSPFVVVPKATFSPGFGGDTISSTFSWSTVCSHVRKQPYIVSFKAKDDAANIPLVNFKTINITVVAPSPKNVTATPSGSSMIVNWTANICSGVAGYKIYRKDSCSSWQHGPCDKGVSALSGYTLIGTSTTTSFVDNNNGEGLIHGIDYSYIVVTVFNDGSESFASAKTCSKLIKDVPIITNVDVVTTNTSTGRIMIKWIKPVADPLNLDTLLYPGPYQYRLMRTTGFFGTTFSQIVTFSSQYFGSLNVTSYLDTLLNTSNTPYKYRIDFYTNDTNNTQNVFKGSTHNASSVYLSIAPADNKLVLSWEEYVPWKNTRYVIYKYNTGTSVFDSLAETSLKTYTDTALINGKQYCYKIKSIGAYSDPGIPSPLINYSEEKCASPDDKQAPCAPELDIAGDCDLVYNYLKWTNPNNSGCGTDDVVRYKIYYTPVENTPFLLLDTTALYNSTDTSYLHNNITSIAGCYVVTAIDSFNNESVNSNVICIDNCPLYELPNVFTPDGDGRNDHFKPLPYKFVKDIDIKIYDRWGLIVFETNDPNIKWDGRSKDSKLTCPDGTYYYTCIVNEIRVSGIKPRTLKGFLQLINSKGNPSSQ